MIASTEIIISSVTKPVEGFIAKYGSLIVGDWPGWKYTMTRDKTNANTALSLYFLDPTSLLCNPPRSNNNTDAMLQNI
jgi:hypothetical protein